MTYLIIAASLLGFVLWILWAYFYMPRCRKDKKQSISFSGVELYDYQASTTKLKEFYDCDLSKKVFTEPCASHASGKIMSGEEYKKLSKYCVEFQDNYPYCLNKTRKKTMKEKLKQYIDRLTMSIAVWLIGDRITTKHQKTAELLLGAVRKNCVTETQRDTAIKERDEWKEELDTFKREYKELMDKYLKCRIPANKHPKPDKDGWIKNTGVMPVGKNILVDVVFKSGKEYLSGYLAGDIFWEFFGMNSEIIKWRPHKSKRKSTKKAVKRKLKK